MDAATFVDKAGRAGAFEVEASKLAQITGASPDVKNFANRMVDDHTHAAAELKQAAGTITVPAEPSADQRAKLDALKGRSGADFDRQYASEVGVSAHEEAVALFDDYAKNGTDANLKAFAAKTLPTLREHLSMAKQMAASVVASK
jgi:putative membrane protein